MIIREDDHRSGELLAEHGRIAARYGVAIAWTSGIVGEKAKRASDSGSGAWKKAKPLASEEFAAGLFETRCRTRNPVVVASASNLVLLEVDGPLELLERYKVVDLPPTVSVRSRRGWHLWYAPPAGMKACKIQVSEDGIDVSADGYFCMPPSLHPSGWVYRYEQAPLWTP